MPLTCDRVPGEGPRPPHHLHLEVKGTQMAGITLCVGGLFRRTRSWWFREKGRGAEALDPGAWMKQKTMG